MPAMPHHTFFALILHAAVFCCSKAANPLVPQAGMADTNVHYFNGTFVIFATHDYSINNTGFLMKDWWCWTSQDLVNWEVASTVKPSQAIPWGKGQEDECWATEGAFRNGRYFFYLSVGGGQVGVVTSSSVFGPWTDPLGKPLLSNQDGKRLGTTFRDPCVFEDDDGQWYLISGVFKYYMAKLNEDMVSFAEPLRAVQVNNPYGPCGNHTTDDKPFLHKNNGLYYLSWGCFYGISTSVYGPYDMKGSVIDTAKIVPAFRMNNSDPQPVPPQPSTNWFRGEDYTDRHGSFLHHNNQWYYASNDRSHSGDKGHEGAFRDTVMCYIHFTEDGLMQPCVIDSVGVGTYDLSSGQRAEAENFFALTGNARKVDIRSTFGTVSNGFAVELKHQAELSFPHVFGFPEASAGEATSVLLLHLLGGHGAGEIAVYERSSEGKGGLLARCTVRMPETRPVSCSLNMMPWGLPGTGLMFTFFAFEQGLHVDNFTAPWVYFDYFQLIETSLVLEGPIAV